MKTKDLTLKEALDSGKQIKRPHDEKWHTPDQWSRFKVEDVKATDWMINVSREWDVYVNPSGQSLNTSAGDWEKIRVREILDHD